MKTQEGRVRWGCGLHNLYHLVITAKFGLSQSEEWLCGELHQGSADSTHMNPETGRTSSHVHGVSVKWNYKIQLADATRHRSGAVRVEKSYVHCAGIVALDRRTGHITVMVLIHHTAPGPSDHSAKHGC
jgi:hypothetical protein